MGREFILSGKREKKSEEYSKKKNAVKLMKNNYRR
jgi:hypothetical protein